MMTILSSFADKATSLTSSIYTSWR